MQYWVNEDKPVNRVLVVSIPMPAFRAVQRGVTGWDTGQVRS